MRIIDKIKILVVEDNLDLLKTYKSLLQTLGFSVQTAANGATAWEFMQSADFDIVFTDIKMPALDGVELLKKIRARNNLHPCVLMISGHTEYPVDLLFQYGVNGFLAKPVSAASIRDILGRIVLRPDELWALEPKKAADAEIVLKFHSFQKLVESGEISFGNGGFSIHQENISIEPQKLVRFSFTFEDSTLFNKIEGVGVVQWSYIDNSEHRKKGLGIEIKYLTDNCRNSLCKWIQDQKFKSFIPY